MSILKPIGYAGAWEFKRPVPTPSGGIADSPQVSVSFNETWIPAVFSALKALTRPEAWEGTLADINRATGDAHSLFDYSAGTTMTIGLIVSHMLGTLPVNWLPCDGSTHLRVDWPGLYALLDAAYIIDADHFKTPDLMGRSPVGAGAGSGLTNRAVDAMGGQETHTLAVGEIPSHQHNIRGATSNLAGGVIPFLAMGGASVGWSTELFGGGTAHNTMHPFTAVKYAVVAS